MTCGAPQAAWWFGLTLQVTHGYILRAPCDARPAKNALQRYSRVNVHFGVIGRC
jgi:hypothetical protein